MQYIDGVVLAGGKSSRFGTDKALFSYKGKPLVLHALDILRPICRNLLISSNQKQAFDDFGATVIGDIYRNCGPLGGIHSALHYTNAQALAVIGCDTPKVPTHLYQLFLQHLPGHHIVMGTHNNMVEATCAIVSKSALPYIEQALERKQYKIINAIEEMAVCFVPLEDQPFFSREVFLNINSKEDLQG